MTAFYSGHSLLLLSFNCCLQWSQQRTVYLHLTLSLWPSSFPLAWQLCLHYLLFTCPKPSQPCLFSFLISSNCCPVPLMYSLIISSMLDTPYDNPLSFLSVLPSANHTSQQLSLISRKPPLTAVSSSPLLLWMVVSGDLN